MRKPVHEQDYRRCCELKKPNYSGQLTEGRVQLCAAAEKLMKAALSQHKVVRKQMQGFQQTTHYTLDRCDKTPFII